MGYSADILALSPVLYWRLGESSGTSAVDASGNGHAGTYVGSPTLAQTGAIAGDANTAVLFNGTSQYVSGPSLGLATNAGVLTYICWIKTTSTGDVLALAEGNSADANPICGFVLGDTGTGKIAFMFRGANNTIEFSSTGTVNDGNWHMLAAVIDASLKMHFFVDGVSQGTPRQLVADTAVFNTFSAAALTRTSVGSYFPGTIDEVAVFSSDQSSQIASLYTAGISGVGYGVSPSSLTGNLVSGNFTVSITGAASFNGSQTVTITSSNSADVITPSVGSPAAHTVTVTPTNGLASFTFDLTVSTLGARTISFTNGQSWSDPSPSTYTAINTLELFFKEQQETSGGTTDLGSLPAGRTMCARFPIENVGTSTLAISSVVVSGSATLVSAPSSLNAGAVGYILLDLATAAAADSQSVSLTVSSANNPDLTQTITFDAKANPTGNSRTFTVGNSWNGTQDSGGSVPTASTTALGTTGFPYRPAARFDTFFRRFFEQSDVVLCVLADTLATGWIRYVEFGAEGGTTVKIYYPEISPRTRTQGFYANLHVPSDGDVHYWARIVPVNGYERVIDGVIHSNATGTLTPAGSTITLTNATDLNDWIANTYNGSNYTKVRLADGIYSWSGSSLGSATNPSRPLLFEAVNPGNVTITGAGRDQVLHIRATKTEWRNIKWDYATFHAINGQDGHPTDVASHFLLGCNEYDSNGLNGLPDAAPYLTSKGTYGYSVVDSTLWVNALETSVDAGIWGRENGTVSLTSCAGHEFMLNCTVEVSGYQNVYGATGSPVPTVTPTGTAGTTTYYYQVVAKYNNYRANVQHFSPSLTTQIIGVTTTGNATLSVSNYNALSWTGGFGSVPSGSVSYDILKWNGTAWLLVGSVSAGVTTFNDTGQSLSAYEPNPSYAGALAANITATQTQELWQRCHLENLLTLASAVYTAGSNTTLLTFSGSPTLQTGIGQTVNVEQANGTGTGPSFSAEGSSIDNTAKTITVSGDASALPVGAQIWIYLHAHPDLYQFDESTGNADNFIFAQAPLIKTEAFQPILLQVNGGPTSCLSWQNVYVYQDPLTQGDIGYYQVDQRNVVMRQCGIINNEINFTTDQPNYGNDEVGFVDCVFAMDDPDMADHGTVTISNCHLTNSGSFKAGLESTGQADPQINAGTLRPLSNSPLRNRLYLPRLPYDASGILHPVDGTGSIGALEFVAGSAGGGLGMAAIVLGML